RPVGRQVPQDLHLSESADRRGERAGRRILLAPVRARGLRRPQGAGRHPGAPLRRQPSARRGVSALAEEALPRTPSFRLDGRRALVAGAGRGIGRAAAVALAEAGAHVVLASRTGAELERLAEAIRAAGGSAEPLVLDVVDVEAAQAAVAAQPAVDREGVVEGKR